MTGENLIQPKPSLSALVTPAQLARLRCTLAQLAGHGSGRLEIVVERSHMRRIIPHRMVHRPGVQVHYPDPSPGLDEWADEIAGGLAEVMAAGWGSLSILVEHARICGVDVAPSLSVDASDLPNKPTNIPNRSATLSTF